MRTYCLALALLMLGLVAVSETAAQNFRRGVVPPTPAVPAWPPGMLPTDYDPSLSPWNTGPLPNNQFGGQWVQPPPGVFLQIGGQPMVQQPMRVQPPMGGVTVYRMVGVTTAEHVYATSFNEVVVSVQSGNFRLEGVAFFIAAQGGPGFAPMARGIRMSKMHFLSTNPMNDNRGQMEGVMGHVQVQQIPGWVPVYEWYNRDKDLFLYTLDPRGEQAPMLGYKANGAIGFVLPPR